MGPHFAGVLRLRTQMTVHFFASRGWGPLIYSLLALALAEVEATREACNEPRDDARDEKHHAPHLDVLPPHRLLERLARLEREWRKVRHSGTCGALRWCHTAHHE